MLTSVKSPPFSDLQLEGPPEVEPGRLPHPWPEEPELLNREQEQALAHQIRQSGAMGEMARTRFVEANLRLVYKVACRYAPLGLHAHLTYEDLVQEGCVGLLTAVDKFDPQRGYRFSTMATWWIMQAITRAINTHQVIHVPVYRMEELRCLHRAEQHLFQNLQRSPSHEELAEAANMPVELVTSLCELRGLLDLRSMDEPLTEEEGDRSLGELLFDAEEDTEERACGAATRAELLAVMKRVLDARELQVMTLRYGFTGQEYTLEEIGQRFRVSRERIRQIEARALRKLRQPCTARKLSA